MEHLTWKLKLVILWIFQVVNFFVVLLISYMESGTFVGRINPGDGSSMGSVFFLITILMIWLSFVSKPTISRWPNIVFGLLIFFMYKAPGVFGYFFGFFDYLSVEIIITELWGAIAAALIVWYGWKIPNQTKVEVT